MSFCFSFVSMTILVLCPINSSCHRECFVRGCSHSLFMSKQLMITCSYLAGLVFLTQTTREYNSVLRNIYSFLWRKLYLLYYGLRWERACKMNQIIRCCMLDARVDNNALSCLLGITHSVPQENSVLFWYNNIFVDMVVKVSNPYLALTVN